MKQRFAACGVPVPWFAEVADAAGAAARRHRARPRSRHQAGRQPRFSAACSAWRRSPILTRRSGSPAHIRRASASWSSNISTDRRSRRSRSSSTATASRRASRTATTNISSAMRPSSSRMAAICRAICPSRDRRQKVKRRRRPRGRRARRHQRHRQGRHRRAQWRALCHRARGAAFRRILLHARDSAQHRRRFHRLRRSRSRWASR